MYTSIIRMSQTILRKTYMRSNHPTLCKQVIISQTQMFIWQADKLLSATGVDHSMSSIQSGGAKYCMKVVPNTVASTLLRSRNSPQTRLTWGCLLYLVVSAIQLIHRGIIRYSFRYLPPNNRMRKHSDLIISPSMCVEANIRSLTLF